MNKQLIFILLTLTTCTPAGNNRRQEDARRAIVRTEKEFEAMAADRGLAEAFAFFADPAATILRGEKVIRGRDSIRLWYGADRFNKVKLAWKPDFVEVSASGDLGYTYGKYSYATVDSTGKASQANGIFHTVWKKQADGSWKYVWD